MPVQYDFDECRQVLLDGLVEALKANRDSIREITENQHETGRIDAVSFDVLPWHREIGVSFRNESDYAFEAGTNYAEKKQKQFWPPDWKHPNYFREHGTFDAAKQYTGELWDCAAESDEGQEAAHVILLAAAHALLDQRVENLLERFGLYAEPVKDRLSASPLFQRLVIDYDATLRANYCEIVLADRVTRRLLGRLPE